MDMRSALVLLLLAGVGGVASALWAVATERYVVDPQIVAAAILIAITSGLFLRITLSLTADDRILTFAIAVLVAFVAMKMVFIAVELKALVQAIDAAMPHHISLDADHLGKTARVSR